jgi:uncharacterized protein (TIGR02145 family)
MAENLAYLPSVNPNSIDSYTLPCYYVYDYQGTNVNDAKATNNYKTYGVLYNSPAANIAAPSGWHTPTDAEWNKLVTYLGGTTIAGTRLKSTTGWLDGGNGDNSSGFNALPNGGKLEDGNFKWLGSEANFWVNWTTTSYDNNYGWCWTILNVAELSHRIMLRQAGWAVRCVKDENQGTAVLPTVTTTLVSAITASTATSGGNITSDGGASVTARGVCWSTSQNPTTTNSKTTDGTGTSSFTSSLTSLTAGTLYYVRSYATNSVGTAYGTQESFTTSGGTAGTVTDADGNVYHTLTIGTQVWMVENLKTTRYNDGTSIPNVTDKTTWKNLTTPGYCWYNNDIANKNIYGGLYNWFTVNTGKLCPTGWHVPTDAEWTTLITFLGGESLAGGKMKETGTIHWQSPNSGANNESGFTALPGGYCLFSDGDFYLKSTEGDWWSSTEQSDDYAWLRYMNKTGTSSPRAYGNKKFGFSVRCIKD